MSYQPANGIATIIVEATEPMFSSPVGSLPNVPGAQVSVTSPPLPAGAEQVITRLGIEAPADNDIVLNDVELMVKNADGTEQIIISNAGPITVPSGQTYYFQVSDFDAPYGVVGSDLSVAVSGDASIRSAAGGSFVAQGFLRVQ